MLRFSIRDLIWLTLLIATSLGWWRYNLTLETRMRAEAAAHINLVHEREVEQLQLDWQKRVIDARIELRRELFEREAAHGAIKAIQSGKVPFEPGFEREGD